MKRGTYLGTAETDHSDYRSAKTSPRAALSIQELCISRRIKKSMVIALKWLVRQSADFHLLVAERLEGQRVNVACTCSELLTLRIPTEQKENWDDGILE